MTLVTFLALIGAIVLLGSPPPAFDKREPANPSLVFPGTEVPLATAQQMVSFSIAAPTFLPRTFSEPSIRVTSPASSPGGAYVYLIYAPVPVSANTTVDDLLAAGGFFIVEVPEPGVDPGSIIDANVLQNGATRIAVNGDPGFYGGNQVHWWAGGVHFAIVSPYSESDMESIAVSMET